MSQQIMPGQHIHRYVVPVDDQWHQEEIFGEVLAVGCRRLDALEFWAVSRPSWALPRRFKVVSTGHPLAEAVWYRGTAVTPEGVLVWHLVEAVES